MDSKDLTRNWQLTVRNTLDFQPATRNAQRITLLLLFFCFFISTISFAQDFTATTIGDIGNVTVMEVTGNYDAKKPDGSTNSAPREVIAKEFFRTHKDEYDFLVIFSNFNFQMLEAQSKAFYHHIKNDIQGIGQQLFDYSSSFGSGGKLEGAIDMGNVANLVLDPLDPQFEETFYILAHEQMHRWGAYVKFKDPVGNISEALLGRDKSHWSFLLDSKASVLYGNQWRDNGDGTFTTINKGKYFSPLDLYLMGLYDRTQVPPMLLIENPSVDPSRLPESGVTISGIAHHISIDDIIAAEGERIPTPSVAQKTFKTAFIFITLPGTFREDALYGIEELRNGWVTRFSILTDGQAIVEVASTPTGEIPTNPGIPEPPTTPRTLPPNIDDGVRWLMNNQRPDGSWMDLPQTMERDTAEIVLVLKDFDFAQVNYSNGLQWLTGTYSGNMDYLSRKIETFVRSGQGTSASIDELLSRQNPDGGWGSNKYYLSSPADTSFALRSLGLTGYQDQTILAKAIEYLKSKQNPDGGWGVDDEGSSIQVTANVLLSFKAYRATFPLEEQIAGGTAWLIQRRNGDGGFGNSPSTVYDTAIALLTLKELGASNEITNPGLNYILRRQSDDGSWHLSPYQTALAVKAAWKATLDPDLSVTPEDISFIPPFVKTPPTNLVITAKIMNLGRTSVPQAKVVLYDGALADSNKAGEQVLAFPGQSQVAVTFSLTIKDAQEHRFYISVDPENLVRESDESNNIASAVWGATTDPDLSIKSGDITFSPPTVKSPPSTVQIHATAWNLGKTDVPQATVALYMDAISPANKVGEQVLAFPGQSAVPVTFSVTIPDANEHSFYISLDPNNLIQESDKANNVALAVWKVSTEPDLSIESADIGFTPPSVTSLPATVAINATAWNLGKTDVPQAKVALYEGSVAEANKIGEQLLTFPAQSSVGFTFSLTIKDGNEHLYYIVLDPENLVTDPIRLNNTAAKVLYPETTYDFEVLSSDLSVSPNPADMLKDVKITSKIANKGTMNAYNVQVKYYVDDVGGPFDIATSTVNIPANSSITNEVMWKANKVGQNLPITVLVDPFNSFDETSKTNNKASTSLTVNALTDPNLSVSYQDILITPSPANERGNVNISAVIKNDGFSSASNIVVHFYKGVPGQDGVLLGSQTIPSLSPGGNVRVSVDWNNIMESGERIIYVQVDPLNQINEIREDDNSAFTTVKILSLPDLAISTNSITFNPAAPKDGDTVAINVTVQNKGEQAASNLLVRASEGATVIGSQVIPSISGNSQAVATITYNTAGKSGPHQITVVVDPDNAIAEQSKDNNQASRTFGVQNANLWLTEPYISPNGDGIKDSTQFFFRLNNPQTIKIAVVNEKGETVRTFSGGLLENTSGGNVTWDGKNDNGVVVADGDYQIKVLDSNNNNLGSLLVVVDNNRSPLIKAIGTKYLLNQNLTCMLPDFYWDWKWFPDESGILLRISEPDQNTPEYPTGLYTMSPDGEDILRIIPWEWTQGTSPQYDYYIRDYALSPDGEKIVFSLLKRKKVAGITEVSQLWVVDRDGNNLTLLDSYDLSMEWTIIENVKWSPDGRLIVYLVWGNSKGYELWVIQGNGAGRTIIEPGFDQWNLETLKWSLDSKKIAYLYQNKIRVSDTTGAKEDIFESSCGQIEWINSQKLLCASEGGIVWLVDASGAGNHLQLGDSLEGYVSIAPNRESVAFKTRIDATLNLYVAGLDGNVQRVHEFQNNAGCYLFSGQIVWASDSKKIATSEGSQPMEGMDCPEQKGYLIVIDTSSNQTTSFPGFFGDLQWFSDNVYLLDGLSVVSSETGETVEIPTDGYAEYGTLSPLGGYVTYQQPVDSSSVCYGRGYSGLWAISSLLNLTADLRIKKEKSAIILKGLAADLNFEGYVLEYADVKSPTVWNLVAPASNVSVINDVFTTWVPPYEGVFYIQLTVWDKAGNVAQDRKRVSWGLSASITNLYKSLEYFSPNGDGIKDTVELRYTVLEPVHLEFNIYDENNSLKRTFLKDYTLPGDDFITWDGRDENGRVVSDGSYKIKVFDYEFFVHLDTTPPDVNIEVSKLDKCTFCESGAITICREEICADISGHAFDNNVKYWVVEYGEGDNPQEWYEVSQGSDNLIGRDENNNPILNPIEDVSIELYTREKIPWLVGKKLRITAEDFAGNRSTKVGEYLEEKIEIDHWDSEPTFDVIPANRARPGLHSLGGMETIRHPIIDFSIQYWQNQQWNDAPPVVNPPSGTIDLKWDNSILKGDFAVRLKAIDLLGQEYYSNELYTNSLFGIDGCTLKAKNTLFEKLKLLRIQVQSRQDPRYGDWTDFDVYDSERDIIPEGEFSPAYFLAQFKPEMEYQIQMVAVGMNGNSFKSNAIEYPPPKTCRGREGGGIEIEVSYRDVDCGLIAGGATINAKPTINLMSNVLSLKTLEYSIRKPEGLQVLRQFDLTREGWGSVKIDTSQMPEGSYSVDASLTYLDLNGNIAVASDSESVVVDRVSPTARITYPGSSLRMCAVRFSDPKGNNWYGIPLEGVVADNTGISRYEFYYGIGENPSAWQLANVKEQPKYYPISGKLGTWDITGLRDRTYSLKLKVVDKSGNASCYTTSFSFDNAIEIPVLRTDKVLFSPNGDGLLDDVGIDYEIDEYARVDARVFKLLKNQDGTYSLDSTPLRAIISGQAHLGGTETTSWDGKDDSGAVVLDGLYGIAVFATDSCGNTNMRWTGVEVHNTTPTTIITYPKAGDPLGNIVEVRGTADDLHFQGYTLEVGQGDAPSSWSLISSDITQVKDDILGRWGTYGLDGRWTLRLTAMDSVGNKNSTTVTIDLGQRKTLIKDLSVNPRLFSPNSDGKLDTTGINYEVTDACNMTIEIFDSGGTARKTYTTTTALAGIYSYIWDGKADTGTTVPEGTFTVRLTAALSSNTSVTQSEAVTIVVDSTPPFIEIKQPLNNSYHKDNVTVIGTVSDKNLSEYSVSYIGEGGTTLLDKANQSRVNYAFGALAEIPEGNYTLHVEARDLAENITRSDTAFTIDRTPPQVTLNGPKDGEYCGSDKNAIAVTGTIVEKNLEAYNLRYGLGENPAQWNDLLTGNTIPTNSQLFTWKVGKNDGVPDGLYTLSLFAKDKAGSTGEAKVKVTVDNTPPEVAITSLADGSYVKAAVDISGTAFDQNLEKYVFEISEGLCSSAFKWAPIKTGTTSIKAGVIASWHALPPDGDYCLRVTAFDKVGNKSEAKVNVKVDTQPPAAPVLSGKIEDKSNAKLTWTANSEPDLSGYNLYRDAKKLNTTLIKDVNYLDQYLKEGTFAYTVTALDLAGNESKLSNQIKLTVDITPPSARISSPQGNAWVSGLVDIKGTAYSPDDFKEYRVSIGQGSLPSVWNLIRTSPLATSYGSLAPWDTVGLPEGIYSIKLEAEDLSGNINTNQVGVNVDNTPPRPPVLLTATATGSDVTLTWQANTEPDLAGYLLYRNDQLANVSGIVIGNLKPYLIAGTTYLNKAVPDGKSKYYLIAMDLAGNTSDPSNTLEADIDTHPPHATIVEPPDKGKFQNKTFIRAESPDTDIASVQFQYKKAQDTVWINLNSPVANSPYGTYLDPVSLGFAHGDYHLRPVATDKGNKTDPSPSLITLTYTDLVAPDAPKDLKTLTNGTDVTLTWTGNTEADLDGYNVYRTSGDSKTKINPAVVKAATYQDNGLSDGTYTYEVTAIDTYGNESKPSNSVSAKVYAPLIQQPYTPTGKNVLEIHGSNSAVAASVEITIEPVSGSVLHITIPSDPTGNFNANNIPLTLGENRITAKATDSAGNVSRISEKTVVVYNEPPSAPTGLTASVSGSDVALTWNSNTESDLSGYNLYRDDKKLNLPVSITPQEGATSSSDMYSFPTDAFDSDPATFWYTYGYGSPVWWEVDLPTPELVNHLEIHWGSDNSQGNEVLYAGKDYEIQVWSGYAWITQTKVTGNSVKDNTFDYKPSYRTDKIRIYVTDTTDPSSDKQLRISEVAIQKDVLITQTSYSDSGTNVKGGTHTFRVTAVDYYGFESPPSEGVNAQFGDSTPPSPPQNLTATATGSNVVLTWSPNSETDPAGYNIYRNTSQGWFRINSILVTGTAYTDRNLPNGTYTYRATALDMVGNESLPSNDATATVQNLILPSKPVIFFPTSYGIPVTLLKNKTDISGSADPSSTVMLLKAGVSVATTTALESDRMESFNFNTDIWGSVSPDGKFLAYESYPALYLQTLATGDRKQIAQGYYPQWSPNGEKLTYVFDDANGHTKIGVYDVIRGSSAPFNGGTETSNEYDSSWSFDGSKMAFLSDRGGVWDVWVLDPGSGNITQVTHDANVYTLRLSADGRKLAYSVEPNFYVTDLVNGTTIQVDTNAEPWLFEWALDSKRVAFTSYRNGNADIFVLDSETGAQTQVTSSANDEMYPSWSPDGQSVVYQKFDQSGYNSVGIASLETPGQQRLLKENLSGLNYLSWLRSGKIAYIDPMGLSMVSLSGHFSFGDISLDPGENIFYATAKDPAGNVSPSSDEISVIFSSALIPDLEITPDDIFIYPAIPIVGEEAAITVTVRNKGQTEVAGVDVNVYLWDSKGNVNLLKSETIANMAPASEEWIDLSLNTTGMTGTNRIIAVVDPEDKIVEASEDNNDATKEFFVVEKEGLFMTTTLDSTQYLSRQDMNIAVNVKNSGAQKELTLEVRVEDMNGVSVAAVDTLSTTLPYASDKDFSFIWNTSSTFSGDYRVHTILREGAVTRVENTIPFTISPDVSIDTNVVTDKTNYGPEQDVLIDLNIKNNGNNYTIPALAIKVRILDPGNQELFNEDREVKNLLPGGTVALTSIWNTDLRAPGDYSVIAETYRDGQLISTKSKSFRIDTSLIITGSTTVIPSVIFLGNTGQADYVIRNDGNVDGNGLLVRLSIVDPEIQATVNTYEETINLGMNASKNGTFSFSTQGYSLKTYVVTFQYVYQGSAKTVGSASFAVKDGLPPVIFIISPAPNSYINSKFDISAMATDDASGVDKVEYQLDGGTWKLLPVSDPSQGRYSTTWTPTVAEEGNRTISFRATDKAGNGSTPVSVPIIVDLTPPQAPVILSPPNNSVLSSELIDITGRTEPGAAVEMSFGGTFRATANSVTGEFTFTNIRLNFGRNLFIFKATDIAGNVSPSTEYAVYLSVIPNSAVTVDRTNYNPDETVSITSTIQNPSQNYSLQNLVARVSVLNSQGTALLADEKQIQTIPLGQTITTSTNWNTSKNPKGTYTVKLEVLDGANIVSTSTASFQILGSSQTGVGLGGTLVAEPSRVYQGKDETLSYSLTNNGNEDLFNLNVRILIINPQTQEIKKTLEGTASVLMGATSSGSFAASTSDLTAGTYTANLEVSSASLTQAKTVASATFKIIQAVTLPFSDNFDSYTAEASPPVPWFELGDKQGIATNTEFHSGQNSITIGGGPDNSQSAFVGLGETYPDRIAYEVWAKVNSTASSAYVGFSEEILRIMPQFNAVYFNGTDGKVYFTSADKDHGFVVPLLDSFAIGVWHKVRVEIDFTDLIADVFIDEVHVGSGLQVSPREATWEHEGTQSFQLNKIGVTHDLGEPFYFDDFFVFSFSGEHTITVTTGAGGTVSPSGSVTVDHRGSQTFTITPDVGQHILDVKVDGTSVGAVKTYTFTDVASDHTMEAVFSINEYTITATAGANGAITPSGPAVVSYGGSQAFTITPSEGYHVLDVKVDGVSVGAVSVYTISNVTADHTVEVSFAINHYTITATAGPNGAISPSGGVTVDHGGSLAFTITPNAGYSISDVKVDGISVGAVTTYAMSNIISNHIIEAIFAINQYTITATAGSGGTITPSGAVAVNDGGAQTFTITPAAGYRILDVKVDRVSVGAVATYTFSSVTSNHVIEATFALNQCTITATAGSNGTITPSGPTTVDYNGSLTFTITPSEGYHIVNVKVDGVSVGSAGSYTFNNVTTDHTIEATFTINQYALIATAGPNGTIVPSGPVVVNHGGSLTFTITPNANYRISDVKVDGGSIGPVATYTFTNVTAAHTIEASFVISQHTITVAAGSNGIITPSGSVTVDHGGSQTFTITPNTGYRISDVEVDGAMLGVTKSYTFNNVTSDHTISATFKGIQVISLPFLDNFDDDVAGTQPASPWDNFNGGPAIVTGTEFHYQPNSLSVSSGSEGNGSAFVNLGETYPDRIAYEVWVKVNSTASSGYVGFSEEILGIIPQFNAVYFNGTDGKVYFTSADREHGFLVPLLNSFAIGVWHKVRVEINFTDLIADVFIDDVHVGSGFQVSPRDATWEHEGTQSFQLNKIGITHDLGGPFYFDDFSVSEWNPNTPINLLRSAGPGQWAVLGMGGIGSASSTSVSMSGSSSVKGAVANMGVANAGSVSMSGSSLINGALSLNTAGRLTRSGTSRVAGGINQNTATDGNLDQAVADALAGSQSAAALPATITSTTRVTISNPSQNITITGVPGTNVLNIANLSISNGTLTLNAPHGGSFIINVSGSFALSGASRIVLAGGITPSDVLYNFVGSGGSVSMSGGSSVSGILLSPQRGISLSGSIVTGEIISGGTQISFSGTTQVNNPGP